MRTTKEELQSSNEELLTVNDELRNRNENLNIATDDLNNVLNASNVPILMVDRELRLRSFTPAAERLIGLSASDIGRGIGDIRNGFGKVNIRQMLEKAVATLAVEQATTQDRSGRWYHVFSRPYRTVDDRIEGAVLTFVDVDDVTKALDAAISTRDFAEGIVETVQHPLLVLDSDLRIRRATAAFYRTFQVSPEETIGQLIYDVGDRQWNSSKLRRLMDEALVRDVAFRDLDVTHDFPRIGRRKCVLMPAALWTRAVRRRLSCWQSKTLRIAGKPPRFNTGACLNPPRMPSSFSTRNPPKSWTSTPTSPSYPAICVRMSSVSVSGKFRRSATPTKPTES